MFDKGRRAFILALGGAAAASQPLWPLAAPAQQSERVRRIGVLVGFAEADAEARARIGLFQQTLEEFGWNDSVQIVYRWASGDMKRMQAHAAELVALKPDVIFGVTVSTVSALLRETRTIPIVFAQVSDPIGSKFVESIAHPGGNVTGFTNFEESMGSKWPELLKEIAPGVKRIAFLFNPETAARGGRFYLQPFEAAAASLAVQPIAAPAHDDAEIERAVAALAREPDRGLMVMPDAFTLVHRERIIAVAASHRIPAIYPFRFFTQGGGLMSYGIDPAEQYPRAAAYVDRILRGAKPADLPVQAPIKFELVINLRTAKALGLVVPPTLIARADEVIE
jgi:putative ABC transport system substrate-binding protein